MVGVDDEDGVKDGVCVGVAVRVPVLVLEKEAWEALRSTSSQMIKMQPGLHILCPITIILLATI